MTPILEQALKVVTEARIITETHKWRPSYTDKGIVENHCDCNLCNEMRVLDALLDGESK